MEKIMNDTRRVAALEDHRPLADSELDAVSGGAADKAAPKLLEACCKGTHIPNVVIEFA
jgi:Type VI secretion system effector, Hcp